MIKQKSIIPSTPDNAPAEAAAIVDPLNNRRASSISRPVANGASLILARDSKAINQSTPTNLGEV